MPAENSVKVSRRNAIKAAVSMGAIGLAGCSGDGGSNDGTPSDGSNNGTPSDGGSGNGGSSDVTAAFIYNGPVGDLGWIRSHERARQAIEEEYDWVTTEYSENIPPGDLAEVAPQYARDDVDIIFATTLGYQDIAHDLSSDWPDVNWEVSTGWMTREPNMSSYYAKVQEARYLTGMAAAMVTETNKLGYVAAFPVASHIREINALTLGARSVNPDITTTARYVNTFHDPGATQQAAQSMIDEGADVISQVTNSPSPVETAAENDVWGVGQYSSMSEAGGENYLTGVILNWENYYGPRLEDVRNDEYEATHWWEGFGSGVLSVDDWGPEVPQDVIDEVNSTKDQFAEGELDIWEGTKFENENKDFIYREMSSYVEGVEGSPPSS